MANNTEKEILEKLTAEFRENIETTQKLSMKLFNPKDVHCSSKLLQGYKDQFIATGLIEAKALLNYWYGHVLKVLKATVEDQPKELYTVWCSCSPETEDDYH